MILKKYVRIRAAKTDTKYVHDKNSKGSTGTTMVIRMPDNSNDKNYQFLIFPVDAAKTSDRDSHYIVHVGSGLFLGIQDDSSKEKKNVELKKLKSSFDETKMWTFSSLGNDEYWITNKESGYSWKIQSGNTENGTVVEQMQAEKGAQAFSFALNTKNTIPASNWVGYINNTGAPEEDQGLIPPLTSLTQNLPTKTDSNLFGEVGIPFWHIAQDPYSKNAKEQVLDTPYYLMRREQRWDRIHDETLVPGNSNGMTISEEHYKGITSDEQTTFTTTTEWTLSGELKVNYESASGAGGSAAIAASISQAIGLEQTSSTQEATYTLFSKTYTFDVEETTRFVCWQVVNAITIFDAEMREVSKVEVHGSTITWQQYS